MFVSPKIKSVKKKIPSTGRLIISKSMRVYLNYHILVLNDIRQFKYCSFMVDYGKKQIALIFSSYVSGFNKCIVRPITKHYGIYVNLQKVLTTLKIKEFIQSFSIKFKVNKLEEIKEEFTNYPLMESTSSVVILKINDMKEYISEQNQLMIM